MTNLNAMQPMQNLPTSRLCLFLACIAAMTGCSPEPGATMFDSGPLKSMQVPRGFELGKPEIAAEYWRIALVDSKDVRIDITIVTRDQPSFGKITEWFQYADSSELVRSTINVSSGTYTAWRYVSEVLCVASMKSDTHEVIVYFKNCFRSDDEAAKFLSSLVFRE